MVGTQRQLGQVWVISERNTGCFGQSKQLSWIYIYLNQLGTRVYMAFPLLVAWHSTLGDHIYPFILPNTVTSSISEREVRRQTIHFLSIAKNLLIITTISYGRERQRWPLKEWPTVLLLSRSTSRKSLWHNRQIQSTKTKNNLICMTGIPDVIVSNEEITCS